MRPPIEVIQIALETVHEALVEDGVIDSSVTILWNTLHEEHDDEEGDIQVVKLSNDDELFVALNQFEATFKWLQ